MSASAQTETVDLIVNFWLSIVFPDQDWHLFFDCSYFTMHLHTYIQPIRVRMMP